MLIVSKNAEYTLTILAYRGRYDDSSSWQNGTVERWVGSCRRELLEHVVVLSERHFIRLVQSYISHHEDRCHLGLGGIIFPPDKYMRSLISTVTPETL